MRHLSTIAIATTVVLMVATDANAQCITPKEEGSWHIMVPDGRGLPHVNIYFHCQDSIFNGEPCCPTGSPFRIEVWGACEPDDCEWGKAEAKLLGNGNLFATYDFGYAKYYVLISRVPDMQPDTLWIALRVIYQDPNRPEIQWSDYFQRDTSSNARYAGSKDGKPLTKAQVRKLRAAPGAKPSAMQLELDPKGPNVIPGPKAKSWPFPRPTLPPPKRR